MEDGKDLWLARATPRAWLQQGRRIVVRGIPTWFSTSAYEIVSDVDHNQITATVDMPSRAPLKSVLLRLRPPKPPADPIRHRQREALGQSLMRQRSNHAPQRGKVAVVAKYWEGMSALAVVARVSIGASVRHTDTRRARPDRRQTIGRPGKSLRVSLCKIGRILPWDRVPSTSRSLLPRLRFSKSLVPSASPPVPTLSAELAQRGLPVNRNWPSSSNRLICP
jgi:hypothetical protein